MTEGEFAPFIDGLIRAERYERKCPYCGSHLYVNRDGTWSCHRCDHYDIDRDDLEVKE